MCGLVILTLDRPKQLVIPSASLTSTSFNAKTENIVTFTRNSICLILHYLRPAKSTKQKGFVRLATTLGDINLKVKISSMP